MGAFELSVHTVWKVKAAVPVKRYDMLLRWHSLYKEIRQPI